MAPYLIRQHEAKAKKMTMSRLIHMAKAITLNTEHLHPPCRASLVKIRIQPGLAQVSPSICAGEQGGHVCKIGMGRRPYQFI